MLSQFSLENLDIFQRAPYLWQSLALVFMRTVLEAIARISRIFNVKMNSILRLRSSRCSHKEISNDREKKEEPRGHTGRAIRRPRTRSPLSRSSHPRWRWTRESSQRVPTSVSPATHNLRPLPVRWSRDQTATPAGKPTVQKGLAPARRIARSEWKKLSPTLGAPCASISAEEFASRRGGPRRHTQAGCLGFAAQTRSTGSCVRQRTQNHRSAAPRPSVSLCLSYCDSIWSVAVQTADSVEHVRCSSGAPSSINIGRNSRDSSAAFSGLRTRFATRAASYHRAPRPLP